MLGSAARLCLRVQLNICRMSGISCASTSLTAPLIRLRKGDSAGGKPTRVYDCGSNVLNVAPCEVTSLTVLAIRVPALEEHAAPAALALLLQSPHLDIALSGFVTLGQSSSIVRGKVPPRACNREREREHCTLSCGNGIN
eukprot:1152822-Pelagomonas_calceolata.AAC.1